MLPSDEDIEQAMLVMLRLQWANLSSEDLSYAMKALARCYNTILREKLIAEGKATDELQ